MTCWQILSRPYAKVGMPLIDREPLAREINRNCRLTAKFTLRSGREGLAAEGIKMISLFKQSDPEGV